MADLSADFDNQGVETRTSNEQEQTEDACRETFEDWLNADGTLARES